PAGGEPVDLQKIAGTVVPVAVPAPRRDDPASAELDRAYRFIGVHETIWADVRAAGAKPLLYARHLGPAGRQPAPGGMAALGHPGPAAAAPANPDSAPASPERLRRMEEELRALRRDLGRLQQ